MCWLSWLKNNADLWLLIDVLYVKCSRHFGLFRSKMNRKNQNNDTILLLLANIIQPVELLPEIVLYPAT